MNYTEWHFVEVDLKKESERYTSRAICFMIVDFRQISSFCILDVLEGIVNTCTYSLMGY